MLLQCFLKSCEVSLSQPATVLLARETENVSGFLPAKASKYLSVNFFEDFTKSVWAFEQ